MLRGRPGLCACRAMCLLEIVSRTAVAAPPAPAAPEAAPVTTPGPVAAPPTGPTASAPAPAAAPAMNLPAAAAPADGTAAPPAAALVAAPVTAPVVMGQPVPPTDAIVHVAADYPRAQLEVRSRVDLGSWKAACAAPCDRVLRVDGYELRVTAPGMSPSNAFLVDPGSGVARFRVAGGSSLHRELGIIGLAAGLPVTFGGMALFGLGSLHDEPGARTAGIATLAVGAAAVLVALPLLLSGSTNVKNEAGRYIARARPALSF